MAGVTHLGVGLAAKRIAPKVPVWILIVAAYVIDILWGVFFFAGLESMPGPESSGPSVWSHGLFMSVVWSLLAGLIAFWASRNRRLGVVIGLLVFSHWVVDFISHPMTAAFPDDTGLAVLFEGSPTIGLGLWSTQLGLSIGEYGGLAVGIIIYAVTLWQLRQAKKAAA